MTNRSPIIVPDLGAGAESLRVSAWLVDLGQRVVMGDRVVEVLVPGITYDIEATTSGELVEITHATDAMVSAGDVLGWIANED